MFSRPGERDTDDGSPFGILNDAFLRSSLDSCTGGILISNGELSKVGRSDGVLYNVN